MSKGKIECHQHQVPSGVYDNTYSYQATSLSKHLFFF